MNSLFSPSLFSSDFSDVSSRSFFSSTRRSLFLPFFIPPFSLSLSLSPPLCLSSCFHFCHMYVHTHACTLLVALLLQESTERVSIVPVSIRFGRVRSDRSTSSHSEDTRGAFFLREWTLVQIAARSSEKNRKCEKGSLRLAAFAKNAISSSSEGLNTRPSSSSESE